jgi:hypothetical protein
MHTCAPPKAALAGWLEEFPSEKGNYGHLLLEQRKNHRVDLVKELRPYFESAHLDAREHFHAQMGIDLHPDAGTEATHATYPACLSSTTRRGLFGEVMAGLITESYPLIGAHSWSVPIFLFRYHADVEKYLFDLVRDPKSKRQTWGRFGTDFLALSLDKSGVVLRFLAGEAKWRLSLTESAVETLMLGGWLKKNGKYVKDKDGNRVRSGRGIWGELNRAPKIPHGLRQLQRLLQECDASKFAATVYSLDKILLANGGPPVPRTDLILIVGNDDEDREQKTSLIPWEKMPVEYKAGNYLQVVEVIIDEGEKLIDDLYQTLWA